MGKYSLLQKVNIVHPKKKSKYKKNTNKKPGRKCGVLIHMEHKCQGGMYFRHRRTRKLCSDGNQNRNVLRLPEHLFSAFHTIIKEKSPIPDTELALYY